MNTLDQLFKHKKNNLLAIYFTAGYPKLDDTPKIIKALEKSGSDLIEVGIPYSDPLADGSVIQKTSEQALKNGLTIDILFQQLASVQPLQTPILLMGYYNQLMKYGLEKFLQNCKKTNVSGLIIPDMPVEIYQEQHQAMFEAYDQKVVFLVTPKTSEERAQKLIDGTTGFVYIVSNSATTGTSNSAYNESFLKRIKEKQLSKPSLVGFGIATATDYQKATKFANGAIIGSAFLKMLGESENLDQAIEQFIYSIKTKEA
ncbi:tryptophan synthase subunit alpha [Weeksella virosa]|uniref:tryptophan synthase subunit alpha n=1 Tax=Weeksella virosa TaxID=1014 RepID=UPI002553E13D|nr:tryptophan synthase subunit alpha [Weeksella virosa]MDK7374091.1 tryptophan synthase subunit alpha [Weeksella virosa]